MKRFLSIVVVLLLFMTVFAGCSDDSNKEEVKTKEKPLVVAMQLTYPPFETKDDKDNPIGVSVDFAKAFGEHIGRNVEIQSTSYDELMTSLQTGKVDMIISSLTITDDKKQTTDFSKPYAHVMLAALTSKDSGITAIENLNQEGKKIAAITDSAGYTYVQKNLPNAEIIALADEKACALEVAQGKADGFISDQLTIYNMWQTNLETTAPVLISNQEAQLWGVAVQKGNTELLAQINEFIETYRVNDGFNKLTNKYLSEEKKAFDELGFKWIFDLD